MLVHLVAVIIAELGAIKHHPSLPPAFVSIEPVGSVQKKEEHMPFDSDQNGIKV